MIKAIIFDFNRTIYDPEKNIIEKETIELFIFLRDNNISLGLISTYKKNRINLINGYNLRDYFDEILFVEEKCKNDFIYIIKKLNSTKEQTLIVGDYLRDEIKIGNLLRIITVWYKRGKFSNLVPGKLEVSKFIISNLNELKGIITYLNTQELNKLDKRGK